MAILYLSPSVREFIKYPECGNEEYYMNLVADAMEPYLYSCGISFIRNNPDESLATAIAEANTGQYQLYLALHSNTAEEGLPGKEHGAEVYYYPGSEKGRKAAQIIARNFCISYPYTHLVEVLPGENMRELRQTKAPAVLVKTAYHDNPREAQWIRDNIHKIGRSLVLSLTQYFAIPFLEPQKSKTATVSSTLPYLYIRELPKMSSTVIGKINKGAYVTVYGEMGGWTVVEYGNLLGFARSRQLNVIRF